VFVRELTAEDARLYLRAQRRRSRGRMGDGGALLSV